MAKVNLKSGKLYILSGIPGSGKSTFTKDLPENMVLSSDSLREKFFPLIDTGEGLARYEGANPMIFDMIKAVLAARCKEGLTTFVDAINPTASDRASFAKIAAQYGMETEVIFFSSKGARKRNKARENFRVPEEAMDRIEENYSTEEALPHRFVEFGDKAEIVIANQIDDDEKIDAIGDVHGVSEVFYALIKKLGYNKKFEHPEGRKILLLGDFVDRGPDSVEMIEVAMRLSYSGHYVLIGNHEKKLLRNISLWKQKKEPVGSPGVLQTFRELLIAKNEDEILAIGEWLKKLPAYYVWKDFAFTHAGVPSFDPLSTPASVCIYGAQDVDTPDHTYESAYSEKQGEHGYRYRIIHGHISGPLNLKSVISLDGGAVYGRDLLALQMDKVKKKFDKGLVSMPSSFSYSSVKKTDKNPFGALIKKKLVRFEQSEDKLMRVFKYSKSVFYKRLWKEDWRLEKARGIVLDFSGKVVSHPFDKVYNYGEYEAGYQYPKDKKLVAVEKLNGFLGIMTANPFTGAPLLHTSGSFTGDYVEILRDAVVKSGKMRDLLKFCKENNVTLMFEVLDPRDPHIIPAGDGTPYEYGIHLIGVRENDWNAPIYPPEKVAKIAGDLGLPTPKIHEWTIEHMLEKSNEVLHEGWVVYDPEEKKHVFKLKTRFYLAGKAIRSLEGKRLNAAFKAPKKELLRIFDEDIVPALGALRETTSMEEFAALDRKEKMETVFELLKSTL